MSINVIIPMAGLGSRFTKYGFTENKYLLPVDMNLTRMIEQAILTLGICSEPGCQLGYTGTNTARRSDDVFSGNDKAVVGKFIFILREENGPDDVLREILDNICNKNNYSYQILSVPALTEGPVCTSYLAKDWVNNDTPLIISNSDQILDWNFDRFYEKSMKYDGSVLTYVPNYELVLGAKDKHSFVRFDDAGEPVEFVEKTVISKEALVGVHFYKKGRYFVESAEYLFKKNIRAPNGEFYLSYTYQAMIDMNYKIGTYRLPVDEYFYPVGEPEDYFKYYNEQCPMELLDLKLLLDYTPLNFPEMAKPFKISYAEKDQMVDFKNELVMIIDGKIDNETDVFVSGKKRTCIFKKNTYFIRVFDVDGEYTNINVNNYLRGWLIGNFSPTLKQTSEFEIALLTHKKDEKWDFHYHKKSKEINILISGKMLINNITIYPGEVFIFKQNIIACPFFLEDCKILCIKLPSVPGDKIII